MLLASTILFIFSHILVVMSLNRLEGTVIERNMKSKVTNLRTNDLPILSGIERITTLVNQNTFAKVHIGRNNSSQDNLVKKLHQIMPELDACMFQHFIGYPIIPTYLTIRQALQYLV